MRWSNQESKQPDASLEATFGAWLTARLTTLGYDLSSRGGGRARLAEESGVSAATIGRAVSGRSVPEPRLLKRMAPVLQVSFGELLVRAGITTEDEVQQAAAPSLTPEQAAVQLGLTDPSLLRLFVSYTTELLRTQNEQRRNGGT
jgi:transcriptional regulator with XRE-family HTH domain